MLQKGIVVINLIANGLKTASEILQLAEFSNSSESP